MDWTLITGLAGVLGLLCSVFVFLLTRWEKRAKLVLHLVTTHDPKRIDPEFGENEEFNSFVSIRIFNVGGKGVIIDPDSFKFVCNGKEIRVRDCDWLGLKHIPNPFNPGTSFEVAVFKDEFERLLGLSLLSSRDLTEQWGWVDAQVASLERKPLFWSVREKYSYAVGEFVRWE